MLSDADSVEADVDAPEGAVVSSAEAVLAPAAKRAVPKRTEQTPMLYFRKEKRWRLLKISFIYRISFFIFHDSMIQIKL